MEYMIFFLRRVWPSSSYLAEHFTNVRENQQVTQPVRDDYIKAICDYFTYPPS